MSLRHVRAADWLDNGISGVEADVSGVTAWCDCPAEAFICCNAAIEVCGLCVASQLFVQLLETASGPLELSSLAEF